MLHHTLVTAPQAQPARWYFVLHGVFGSGKNWQLFTRHLAEARPDLGFVLADLRGHGRSASLDPPHDLAAAAADVDALGRHLRLSFGGVIGHSLGGKVALLMRGNAGAIWLLDSQPGAHAEDSQTTRVLEVLESMPESVADRRAFTDALEERGLSRELASWLAMSVKRGADDRYRLTLDLAVIRCLLEDHMRRDLWPDVDRAGVHLVVATGSFVWQPSDRERLDALRNATVHRIEGAGHWLHVDAPDALRELLAASL